MLDRQVSGVIRFQVSNDDIQTVVSRVHTVFATGVAVPTDHGRLQLMLTTAAGALYVDAMQPPRRPANTATHNDHDHLITR
jgi:hypothetical protein